jgi:hypothetical protein
MGQEKEQERIRAEEDVLILRKLEKGEVEELLGEAEIENSKIGGELCFGCLEI